MRLITLAIAARAWIAALALVSPPAHRWSAAPASASTSAQRCAARRRRRPMPNPSPSRPSTTSSTPRKSTARGVCVIDETEPEICEFDENMEEIICVPAETPLWPKALLLGSSVLYGTNFALGRLMNDALSASRVHQRPLRARRRGPLPFY